MNIKNKIIAIVFLSIGLLHITACDDITPQTEETPDAPYILSLGIMANGSTTYYVVSTDNLMTGNINAIGKGIEQNGYRDYEQGGNTLFSIGGLGITQAVGITRNTNGYLQEKGDFVFDQRLSLFSQINPTTMMGVEIPSDAENGDSITFYTVDISSISITRKQAAPIAPLAEVEWPSLTGMAYSEGKIYLTYLGMNPKTYETKYTDTTYVAVYTYPEMKLDKIMKDTRTGPAGSWNANNGILQTETGDIYLLSNSSLANGYSQQTKNAGFVRITKGETSFDNYYFDFEKETNGLRPAHIKYIGNGLVFAQVSTLKPQTLADRWSDKNLKCSIIDLYNKTVTDIPEIPIHNGNGGRRFAVLVEQGDVYFPVTTAEGTYIYRINPQTASAVQGAKIATTFVGGFAKL